MHRGESGEDDRDFSPSPTITQTFYPMDFYHVALSPTLYFHPRGLHLDFVSWMHQTSLFISRLRLKLPQAAIETCILPQHPLDFHTNLNISIFSPFVKYLKTEI